MVREGFRSGAQTGMRKGKDMRGEWEGKSSSTAGRGGGWRGGGVHINLSSLNKQEKPQATLKKLRDANVREHVTPHVNLHSHTLNGLKISINLHLTMHVTTHRPAFYSSSHTWFKDAWLFTVRMINCVGERCVCVCVWADRTQTESSPCLQSHFCGSQWLKTQAGNYTNLD